MEADEPDAPPLWTIADRGPAAVADQPLPSGPDQGAQTDAAFIPY